MGCDDTGYALRSSEYEAPSREAIGATVLSGVMLAFVGKCHTASVVASIQVIRKTSPTSLELECRAVDGRTFTARVRYYRNPTVDDSVQIVWGSESAITTATG